ncbi:M64 family metallopeptidase [Streptomyces tanashiensis]|uniref:M64 family metallopeptidase n=1 Tax=Streptomyces tanashiensis TaxID=67367 RepID=UPI0033ED3D48
MGVNDGTVIGSELLLDHGSPIDRWNLTLVSEGYTEQELPNFRLHSLEFVTLLLATPPFAGPSAAINVYRLDVASSQSGADDPAPCGTGATADTFFDARFCANGLDRRVLVVDTTLALNTVYAELPWSHAILVIVNSPSLRRHGRRCRHHDPSPQGHGHRSPRARPQRVRSGRRIRLRQHL